MPNKKGKREQNGRVAFRPPVWEGVTRYYGTTKGNENKHILYMRRLLPQLHSYPPKRAFLLTPYFSLQPSRFPSSGPLPFPISLSLSLPQSFNFRHNYPPGVQEGERERERKGRNKEEERRKNSPSFFPSLLLPQPGLQDPPSGEERGEKKGIQGEEGLT